MTPEEKQEIINAVISQLLSSGCDITGLDAAQSLDGISTFPAVLTTTNNGVTTKALVSVPISLLTQAIQDVITNANTAASSARSAAAGWAAAAVKMGSDIVVIEGDISNLQNADKSLSSLTAYAECSTAANVSSKAVTVPFFSLPTNGGCLHVKMANANTAVSGVTLNINATGAKGLLYNGSAVSATNTWEANEVLKIYYDGTNYQATNAQGGGGSADKISYDNSQSELDSENVQDAIDEVKGLIGNSSGGLSNTAISLLQTILTAGVYVSNQSSNITSLITELENGSSSVVVATPVITASGTQVTISCATQGATIYYTTNGDTPTSQSSQYSASFEPNANCTIKAIAIKDGDSSSVATYNYQVPSSVATPVITLTGAVATITCETSGATIYYTLDNTAPSSSSSVYSSGVTLTNGQTIRAIAIYNGESSYEATPKTYSDGTTETVQSFSNYASSGTAGNAILMPVKNFNFENSVRVSEIDVKIAKFSGNAAPSSHTVPLYRLTIENDSITETYFLGDCLLNTGDNQITEFTDSTPIDFELASNQSIVFGQGTSRYPLPYYMPQNNSIGMWSCSDNDGTITKGSAYPNSSPAINIVGTKIIS